MFSTEVSKASHWKKELAGMIVIYVLILFLSLYGISFNGKTYNEFYIGKEQCNAVKGIFLLFVFGRHIWPYMQDVGYDFSAFGDQLFLSLDKRLGQLIVVMFLFYSGYGIMESVKAKGQKYIDSLPKKRILKTLVNFDIAVFVFILTNLLLGKPLELSNTLLAFTGWTSVENSNWYIFIILLCYTATWIGVKFFKWWVSILIIIVCLLALQFTKDVWWYNTILSFPAGLIYSKYKTKLENHIKSKYLLSFFICLIVFLITYKLPIAVLSIKDNVMSIAFALLFLVATMKIKVGNTILYWLGKNLFPLYIYQRIPMFIFASINDGIIASQYHYLYILICAIITIIFGKVFRFLSI